MVKYAVLITCFNERDRIADVIARVQRHNRHLLVVDDGSHDGSREIIVKTGAPALFHAQNGGKGAAIRTGLTALLARDYDYVVFMDGDGQHDPDDLPAFLAEAEKGTDFICGNRMENVGDMPYKRFFTNRMGSWALSHIVGARIPDTMVGYRMIATSLLRRFPLISKGFTIETEMLIRCFKHQISYANVPVRTIYHQMDDNKYRGFVDSWRIFFFCGGMEGMERQILKHQLPTELLPESRCHWANS
ncbi:MAG: glycosyltransferase family 2 protein [Acidobacteria bacterium]|nr:glycosyltransferase family 2 protein [Acidobacteriota bacterium]